MFSSRPSSSLVALAVVTLLLGAAPAFAQEVHDDPSMSGTTGLFVIPRAGTLEPGGFSLGASWSEFDHEDGDSQVHAIGVMGAYGLTERLEIFARFEPHVDVNRGFTAERQLLAMMPGLTGLGLDPHPYAFGPTHPDDPYDGVGDLWVGAKYRLAGDPHGYDGLALAGTVKVPTSGDDDTGIGTGGFDLGARLIGSVETWEAVGWNAHVGYVYRSDPELEDIDDDEADPEAVPAVAGDFFVSDHFLYGVGVQFPTRSMLQVIMEAYGIVTTEDVTGAYIGGDDAFYLQGGARLTTDAGFALSGAVNYNANIALRDPAWQDNPDELDDAIDRFGFLAMASYSPSGRTRVTYVGAPPESVPPVNRPPSLTCRAERQTVRSGEAVRLFADASDPDGDPLEVSWSVSAGSLEPTTGTEVTWSSAGVEPGSGPITARVSDGYGGNADCTLRVTVEPPPPPAAPEPAMYPYVCQEFASGSARVDNRCKAVLDDVALQLRQSPAATAAVTGHTDSTGSREVNMRLARERADNVKAYLVDTHGIDDGRITVRAVGPDDPLAEGEDAAQRANNRRVAIVVTIPTGQ